MRRQQPAICSVSPEYVYNFCRLTNSKPGIPGGTLIKSRSFQLVVSRAAEWIRLMKEVVANWSFYTLVSCCLAQRKELNIDQREEGDLLYRHISSKAPSDQKDYLRGR